MHLQFNSSSKILKALGNNLVNERRGYVTNYAYS